MDDLLELHDFSIRFGAASEATAMRKSRETRGWQESSGNVFRDLGFGVCEAERMLMKCDLTIALQRVIKYRRLSHSKASALLGVETRRVTALKQGKFDEFSIGALVNMLRRAGKSVRVTVSDARPGEPIIRPQRVRNTRS